MLFFGAFVSFLSDVSRVSPVPWSPCPVTGVDVNLVEETRKAVLGSEREGARWVFLSVFTPWGLHFSVDQLI